MENIYTIKESLMYSPYEYKLSLRIFINTSPPALPDRQILKLIPNEHFSPNPTLNVTK